MLRSLVRSALVAVLMAVLAVPTHAGYYEKDGPDLVDGSVVGWGGGTSADNPGGPGAGMGAGGGSFVAGSSVSVNASMSCTGGYAHGYAEGWVSRSKSFTWRSNDEFDSPGTWHTTASLAGDGSASASVSGDIVDYAWSGGGESAFAYANWEKRSDSASASWSGSSTTTHEDEWNISLSLDTWTRCGTEGNGPVYAWYDMDGNMHLVMGSASGSASSSTRITSLSDPIAGPPPAP